MKTIFLFILLCLLVNSYAQPFTRTESQVISGCIYTLPDSSLIKQPVSLILIAEGKEMTIKVQPDVDGHFSITLFSNIHFKEMCVWFYDKEYNIIYPYSKNTIFNKYRADITTKLNIKNYE